MKRLWEQAITARGLRFVIWSPVILLLRLITPLYQFFSRRHLARRRQQRSAPWRARVVSVGNITVGGSGKTPIVMFLARRWIAAGRKVVIVHSGYGRAQENNLLIDYGQGKSHPVEKIGDETAMMAAMIPEAAFAVGRDKKQMIILADQRYCPDIIIIDDGYQRLDIAANLNIAVVGPDMAVATHRLFPAGILREPPVSLARAEAVFVIKAGGVTGRSEIEAFVRLHNSAAPILGWMMRLDGADCASKTVGLDFLKGRRPYLFAGIGSFARMYDMVRQAGIHPVGVRNFGDHHRYSDNDFACLQQAATEADCYLTTAKDMAKLADRPLDRPIYCLRLIVEPEDVAAVNLLIDMDQT